MNEPAGHAAASAFGASVEERFGRRAAVLSRAPGRINLIGEHIDYCGGIVMPIAIPQACHVAIVETPGAGERCVIGSSMVDKTIEFDPRSPLQPGAEAPMGSWPSYILGVVAGFQSLGPVGRLAGHRIQVHTDVPVGAGLSSSAALEVAVAVGLSAFLDVPMEGLAVAKLAQQAEHEYAGVPCGLMDQATSALARAGQALLLDCSDESVAWAPIMPSAELVVVHSGVSHALADGTYARRRNACESAAVRLGVEHLAHAPADDLAALPASERPFARHVISEQARVIGAKEALEAGDAAAFGRLMSASHVSMRDDFEISCIEIDALVEAMGSAEGCFGARMTGGGLGGCVIALTEPGAGQAVLAAAETRRDLCPNQRPIPVFAADGASLVIA